MNRRREALCGLLVAASLVASIASSPAASSESESDDPPVTLFGDCFDVVAFVEGVARDPVDDAVREPFEPIKLADDTTMLFVHALWCGPGQEGEGGAAIHGQARPTVVAQFSAVIDRPAAGSDASCPVCDWYLFDWVTDNGELVGWLKDGTGFGESARHGDLILRHDGFGADNFSLQVPGLFEMHGRLEDARRYPVVPTAVKGGYWSLTNKGAVKIPSWNATARMSPVPIELTITPDHGTLMWELFGAQKTRTARNPFGSIAFSCGFYQKQVFATPSDAQTQADPGPCLP